MFSINSCRASNREPRARSLAGDELRVVATGDELAVAPCGATLPGRVSARASPLSLPLGSGPHAFQQDLVVK